MPKSNDYGSNKFSAGTLIGYGNMSAGGAPVNIINTTGKAGFAVLHVRQEGGDDGMLLAYIYGTSTIEPGTPILRNSGAVVASSLTVPLNPGDTIQLNIQMNAGVSFDVEYYCTLFQLNL